MNEEGEFGGVVDELFRQATIGAEVNHQVEKTFQEQSIRSSLVDYLSQHIDIFVEEALGEFGRSLAVEAADLLYAREKKKPSYHWPATKLADSAELYAYGGQAKRAVEVGVEVIQKYRNPTDIGEVWGINYASNIIGEHGTWHDKKHAGETLLGIIQNVVTGDKEFERDLADAYKRLIDGYEELGGDMIDLRNMVRDAVKDCDNKKEARIKLFTERLDQKYQPTITDAEGTLYKIVYEVSKATGIEKSVVATYLKARV